MMIKSSDLDPNKQSKSDRMRIYSSAPQARVGFTGIVFIGTEQVLLTYSPKNIGNWEITANRSKDE